MPELQRHPFDSEPEPSVTMSASPVSLLTGDGAFLMPVMHIRALLRGDGATPPDNGERLYCMGLLKTGDGAAAGRWWGRCGC